MEDLNFPRRIMKTAIPIRLYEEDEELVARMSEEQDVSKASVIREIVSRYFANRARLD